MCLRQPQLAGGQQPAAVSAVAAAGGDHRAAEREGMSEHPHALAGELHVLTQLVHDQLASGRTLLGAHPKPLRIPGAQYDVVGLQDAELDGFARLIPRCGEMWLGLAVAGLGSSPQGDHGRARMWSGLPAGVHT